MSQISITCDICYDNPIRYIICSNCETTSCDKCQLLYGRPFCQGSKCNLQFTQYQLLTFIPKGKIDISTLGKYWKDIYLNREKNKLPLSIEYIDYMKQYNEYLNQKRFGSFSKMKKFVIRNVNEFLGSNDVLYRNCSEINCKGFIVNNICNLCNKHFCSECFEVIKITDTSKHICDKSTILSIKEKLSNSKPCPNCYVFIHKSVGCDHMRCTNCGTYFSYSTLRIQQKNSNPISDSELLKKNLNTNTTCSNYDIHNYLPNIAVKTCSIMIDRDPFIIQSTFLNKFNDKMMNNYNNQLLKYRILFIENKLEEKDWIEKIYKTEYDYQRNISLSDVFLSYLSFMTTIINEINSYYTDSDNRDVVNSSNDIIDDDEFIETLNNKIIKELEYYNKMFIQISAEYGGKILRFKLVNDNSIPLYL